MEKRRKISLWFITALLFPFIFCSITSCSDDDNDNNKKNYKYLYASNERENTSLADREKYAPYGWRLECLTDETMPKNYRTCLDDFKERDVIPGYDPDYMPSIKGLKELKASASANFSSSGFDGLLSALCASCTKAPSPSWTCAQRHTAFSTACTCRITVFKTGPTSV